MHAPVWLGLCSVMALWGVGPGTQRISPGPKVDWPPQLPRLSVVGTCRTVGGWEAAAAFGRWPDSRSLGQSAPLCRSCWTALNTGWAAVVGPPPLWHTIGSATPMSAKSIAISLAGFLHPHRSLPGYQPDWRSGWSAETEREQTHKMFLFFFTFSVTVHRTKWKKSQRDSYHG